MGKYFSNERRDAWRKQSGFKTTTEVLAAEKESRTREVSMDEAMRMVNETDGGGGGGSKTDKIVRLLESIDRKLDNLGTIG